jgi:hypothetical protein
LRFGDDSLCRFGLRYGSLSLFYVMCVKEIFRLGKGYVFPRPVRCLHEGCGSSRIWGHGFVLRYLDGYAAPLWFRRWRCPDCGCVYTIQHTDYWPRHHAPIQTVVASLSHRITHGFWDQALGLTRQRQGHWMRALRSNIKTWLGMDVCSDLINGLHKLIAQLRVPVVRLV